MALAPSPSRAATVAAPASSRTSATTTRAPSSAKRSQHARPMPLPPPVTTATLPSSRPVNFSPCLLAELGRHVDHHRGHGGRFVADWLPVVLDAAHHHRVTGSEDDGIRSGDTQLY